jgi:hypothetical protein
MHLVGSGVSACTACNPEIRTCWCETKEDYLVDGLPALTENSFITCQKGGVIRFVKSPGTEEPSAQDIVNSVNAVAPAAVAAAMAGAMAIPTAATSTVKPPFDKSDISKKDSDTYKILADLEKRWADAGQLPETEREELRRGYEQIAADAKRLVLDGTPYLNGQELVEDSVHENAKSAAEYQSKLIMLRAPALSSDENVHFEYLPSNDKKAYLEHSTAYLALRAQTDWDYKENRNFQVGGNDSREKYRYFNGLDMDEKGANRRNWTPWIYFEGKVIAGDDVGNINMAYVGKKMNLPPAAYKNFATEKQFPKIWADDERDVAAIEWGMELADSGW